MFKSNIISLFHSPTLFILYSNQIYFDQKCVLSITILRCWISSALSLILSLSCPFVHPFSILCIRNCFLSVIITSQKLFEQSLEQMKCIRTFQACIHMLMSLKNFPITASQQNKWIFRLIKMRFFFVVMLRLCYVGWKWIA